MLHSVTSLSCNVTQGQFWHEIGDTLGDGLALTFLLARAKLAYMYYSPKSESFNK